MGVPSNVVDRIDKLERMQKHVEQRRSRDQAAMARRQAVTADRNARRPLLMELAKDIFDWRDTIVKSRDGQRLWNLLGGARIDIYWDWFWHGLPVPKDNEPGAHTRVFLDGQHHHFLVEEWRSDPASGNLAMYHEACRLKSPLEMVDQLHPRMIEGMQTHLSGPGAWQTLLDELDRRLALYPNVG